MPLFEDSVPIDAPLGVPAPKEQSVLGDFWEQPQPVGFLEGLRAGVQLENPVLEALRAADYLREDNLPEPGFNFVEYAKENGVEDLTEQLSWANNRKYADAILKHALEERDLRRARDASGAGGIAGSLVGSLASPTNLIPGSGLVRAVRGGYAVGRSAAGVAAMAGGSAALDEAMLQAAQQERTGAESAVAIGGGLLLGGLLGGAAASVLGKVERELFERGWKELNANTGASAGAEAARKWSYDDLSVSGWAARGIVNAMDFINPNIRLATSASLVAREIGQMLGEHSIYYRLNDFGASAAPAGAVETETMRLVRSTLNLGFTEMEAQYKAMKKAGTNMTWDEFDQAVGRAMRRGDQGDNDFVSAAASALRAQQTDKLKQLAVKEGLLPEDIKVSEAESYFSRVYNVEKITATDEAPDGFKERILPWLKARMEESYQEHMTRVLDRVAGLKTDIEDMRLDKQGRLNALADIDARMTELATNYREGFDADQELKRLRREATKAKKAGDTETETRLREQAKDVAAQAEEYRKAAGPVLRRRRVIERGTGGTDVKLEKIQDQLVKLEEANLTSLRRLVTKGQWLQKELGKIDTNEQLAEKIQQLNEMFNQVAKQFDDGLDRIAETRQKIEAEGEKLKEAGKTAEGKTGVERAQGFEEYKKAMAPMQERLSKFENTQAARRAKLDRIAQKIDAAELVDPVELRKALDDMVEEFIADISSMSLGRGERAARLLERMEKLDPELVKAQIAKLEERAKKLHDDFYQRWEVKMLGDGVDLKPGTKPKFDVAAKDAAQEIFDLITGRANLMNSHDMAEWRISPRRGPLKDRTFHIPDEMIEDFLNSSARQVQEIMTRRLAGQIVLQKKFGSTTLEPQIKEIKADYDKLKAQVAASGSYQEALQAIGKHYGFKEKIANSFKGYERTQQGLQSWLEKEMQQDVHDIQGLRDLILGRFRPDAHGSNLGRTIRGANQINYVRLSGKFLIASLADMYRAPMMQGLSRSLGALPSMLSSGLTSDGIKATTAAINEAKLAGLISERMLHTKMASIAELGDPFAHGNRAERFLENMSRLSTKWNGMALWQDWLEGWTSIVAQNKMVDAIKVADPKSVTGNDRWLAMLGVDRLTGTARQVQEELAKHAEKVDGIWVANTEKWSSQRAVDAYRNALAKEVSRTIIRPSQGDVPLFWKTPAGQALFQFRSFLLSAHQRIMLAGLQEGPARFLSGLVGMTTIGMAVSYLKALGNGKDSFERWKKQAENPMYLLGEGLDNSAMFPLFFELSNSTEKVTKSMGFSFNPIKSPLKAAYDGNWQVDSQKNWNVPLEQSLFGPGVGMLGQTARAAGTAVEAARGEEVTKGQIRQSAAMIPFSTHLGFKEMIQLLNDDLPYTR